MDTRPSSQPVHSPSLPSPTWRSQDLLRGLAEVRIVHGQEVYRLRRTALGKLILTK